MCGMGSPGNLDKNRKPERKGINRRQALGLGAGAVAFGTMAIVDPMGLREQISPSRRPLDEKRIEDIRFKATDAAVRTFEKAFKGDKNIAEKSKAVRAIMNEFFKQQVENIELFPSQKHGVSFLHSAIDVGEMAKKLYARKEYGGSLPQLRPAPEGDTKRIHEQRHDSFIFSSFISPKNPSALFVFFEQGLNELVRQLPGAIEDIRKGIEPAKHIFHYVGTPTRDIGHITPDFVDSLKGGKAFEVFGDMYAELVQKYATAGGEILLRGISMGAPFALETAKKLKADKAVTQNLDEARVTGVPHLSIRVDTPPSQNNTQTLPPEWQIWAGFGIDGVLGFLNDPMTRASSNPLTGSVVEELKPILERKGIKEEMSPEDELLKKTAIKEVINTLYKGTPVPADLKVTEVIGTEDFTMFLPLSPQKSAFTAKVEKQRSEHTGSLGERRTSEKFSDRRTVGVNMGHVIPNITPTVLRRLKRTTESLLDVRSQEAP